MIFTKLKLIGFKSFVDDTNLDIKSGLTGLVGPNGCGKSNIVEAVKWNMGEAGPSKLRAGEMDDVIFNGTKGRPSRNSAEVIINMELDKDDSNRKYATQDEIQISRKINKSEGSRYTINAKEVRQRDVQIFFADYAIGSRSNAIVDQGQIGKIINSKPQERRQIIEEASGITGIHARKHETELKLNAAENNLNKLEEIISNDRLRLKDLIKQSNQAKKYKVLSEKIRNIENYILYHQWNEAVSNIKNIEMLLDKYSDEADIVTAKISNISVKIKNLESNVNSLKDEHQTNISLLNKSQLEFDLIEKDKESSYLNIKNINEDIEYLQNEQKKEYELQNKLLKQLKEIEDEIKINKDKSNLDNKINYDKEIKNINTIQKKIKENEAKLVKNVDDNNKIIRENKDILNKKNIILAELSKEIEKHKASSIILTKLFESKDKNTIINKISFSNGYEKAIGAALGYGLKASLSKSNIEWRQIKQSNLPSLPTNIQNLENTIQGVPEIANLLKSTGLVKNKLEGEKLQNLLQPGQQLVSKEGDLWRWDGYKHSAEAETPVHQMLQNKKNMEKINLLLKDLNKEFDKVNKEKKDLENHIRNLDNQNENFLSKINSLRTEHDKYQVSYSQTVEKNSENKSQLTILISSQKEYERIKSQLKIIDERIIKINDTIKSQNEKLLIDKKKPNDLKLHQIQTTKEIESHKKLIQNLTDTISIKENEYSVIQNQYKTINNQLMQARENKARQEGIYQEAKEKLNSHEKIIFDKLNIKPNNFDTIIEQPFDTLPDLEDCNITIEKYNLQRERIGPVNLIAEKDSEELLSKISDIDKEKEDLINAIQKLRDSISNINKEARSRLINAFDEVNKHFKILFTDLFGGGEAHLTLEGSDDPLEAGLELFASPPGKKLQNMSLLSGGEQALTSMALIFSIFLTKPSPICILDEVDAPLDESNVDRFLDLIRAIADKTQTRFIVVTHNRLSMSKMDRLYGVTMQEPGVSQLVSVSLQEAVKFNE